MTERKNRIGSKRSCAECGTKFSIGNFRKNWLKSKNRYQYCSYCLDCERELHKQYKRRTIYSSTPIQNLESEIWKSIPGFDGLYEASNMQRIKSLKKVDAKGSLRNAKIMRQTKSTMGYLRTELRKDGVSKIFGSHVLICLAFHPNPENKPMINHKNGIKDCNYEWNLEWVTQQENAQHAVASGLIKQVGEMGYFAKLTNTEAKEIFSSSLTIKELCLKYSVCQATVYKIRGNRSWKQVNTLKL